MLRVFQNILNHNISNDGSSFIWIQSSYRQRHSETKSKLPIHVKMAPAIKSHFPKLQNYQETVLVNKLSEKCIQYKVYKKTLRQTTDSTIPLQLTQNN